MKVLGNEGTRQERAGQVILQGRQMRKYKLKAEGEVSSKDYKEMKLIQIKLKRLNIN